MADLSLGIVIVHYNTADLLRGCLSSLQGCSLSHRIVVVDNASTDDAVEMMRRDFSQALLLVNPENYGFARAANQGMRALSFPEAGAPDYALLLNPDTQVENGALETLVAFMEAHPDVGAAGPRLLNPDGSIQENAFTFPTLLMSFFDFFPIHGRLCRSPLNGRYRQMYGEKPFPIDHPLGACLLLRREALSEVGLLDEGYFMYVEEVDLCYRMQQAGWKIYHVPSARVLHHGGQSTKQWATRMFVELHRSRYRFFHKYYPPAFLLAHRRITRLGLLWRAWKDRRDCRAGRITSEERDQRLEAYRQVAAMR